MQVDRKDAPLDRDPVADPPPEALGQHPPGERARAVADERIELGRVNFILGVHARELGRLAPELGEEVRLVDVDAAEPLHPCRQGDARHLLDLLLVGDRQRVPSETALRTTRRSIASCESGGRSSSVTTVSKVVRRKSESARLVTVSNERRLLRNAFRQTSRKNFTSTSKSKWTQGELR